MVGRSSPRPLTLAIAAGFDLLQNATASLFRFERPRDFPLSTKQEPSFQLSEVLDFAYRSRTSVLACVTSIAGATRKTLRSGVTTRARAVSTATLASGAASPAQPTLTAIATQSSGRFKGNRAPRITEKVSRDQQFAPVSSS